jgi:hypothetical protein
MMLYNTQYSPCTLPRVVRWEDVIIFSFLATESESERMSGTREKRGRGINEKTC